MLAAVLGRALDPPTEAPVHGDEALAAESAVHLVTGLKRTRLAARSTRARMRLPPLLDIGRDTGRTRRGEPTPAGADLARAACAERKTNARVGGLDTAGNSPMNP